MLEDRTVYAAKHRDASVRAASRSGGVFTALSDAILDDGGVIYGCALDDSFLAFHERAADRQARDRFRGSKYIPSRMGDCYARCAQDLKDGLSVLFSGTPCQIEALNGFLEIRKVPTDKLVTLEVLCHGVASPKVWTRYLEWIADGGQIDGAEFRDKARFGWTAHKETVTVNGEAKSSDAFAQLYRQHIITPDHCAACRFKRTERAADVTIGDYWHLNEIDPQFGADDQGVSFVLLNSAKGEELFHRCASDLEVRQYSLSRSMQPALYINYKPSNRRKAFYRALDKMPFDRLIQTFTTGKEPFYAKLIQALSAWKRKIAHG